VFDHVGWGELLVLAVVGLFVFGPERLPKIAADAARFLRQVRQMARSATDDLRAELGPEMADLDLRSLNPKRFVQDALLGDDDEPAPVQPAAPRGGPPLRAGERPPYDVDAT
jgi:sec-independent protein translocase protein TatB